ncbi:hypothetical protein SEA_JACOREN57_54 [Mycobacterium phage JacoRen57]|nr:hypothetical protein SEA_JACOREN57_54 [Mycobacterium phage JacoRen57]
MSMSDAYIREAGLSMALRLNAKRPNVSAEQVIADAKKFSDYLKEDKP